MAVPGAKGRDKAYDLTLDGTKVFESLGIEVEATRALRRRFACACLDWSERRPHLGGALGAALLKVALKRKWVIQDLDSRALDVRLLRRSTVSATVIRSAPGGHPGRVQLQLPKSQRKSALQPSRKAFSTCTSKRWKCTV
jgi:hypothetical protein